MRYAFGKCNQIHSHNDVTNSMTITTKTLKRQRYSDIDSAIGCFCQTSICWMMPSLTLAQWWSVAQVSRLPTRSLPTSVDILGSGEIQNRWSPITGLSGKCRAIMLTQFNQGTSQASFHCVDLNGEGEINAVKLLMMAFQ